MPPFSSLEAVAHACIRRKRHQIREPMSCCRRVSPGFLAAVGISLSRSGEPESHLLSLSSCTCVSGCVCVCVTYVSEGRLSTARDDVKRLLSDGGTPCFLINKSTTALRVMFPMFVVAFKCGRKITCLEEEKKWNVVCIWMRGSGNGNKSVLFSRVF